MLCSLSCAVTDRSPGDCEHFAWNGCHWCHLHHGPIASGCNSASIWSSLQRQQLLLHSHTLSSHHPVVFIMKIFQEATSNIPRSPSVFKVMFTLFSLLLPLIWGNLSLPVSVLISVAAFGSVLQQCPPLFFPNVTSSYHPSSLIIATVPVPEHCYPRTLLGKDGWYWPNQLWQISELNQIIQPI